jgi:hypothetical protein
MPVDPNFPTANTLADAVQMRAQLNGLFDLIVPGPQGPQGIPGSQGVPGSQGAQGEQGLPFAAVVVDGVTTLPPGSAATVTANLQDGNVHLLFGVPSGSNGSDGANGQPFATVVVQSVTTLPAGSDATVTAVLDGDVVRLTFGLPRGVDGINGANGADGANGSDGATGEVTAAQLSSAISGTSNNTDAVGLLNLAVSDPPTQSELQAVANKLDELILALRR